MTNTALDGLYSISWTMLGREGDSSDVAKMNVVINHNLHRPEWETLLAIWNRKATSLLKHAVTTSDGIPKGLNRTTDVDVYFYGDLDEESRTAAEGYMGEAIRKVFSLRG